MIKGLLFTLVIFAVLWLAFWVSRADASRRGGWSPFDMRKPSKREPPLRESGVRAPPERRRRSR